MSNTIRMCQIASCKREAATKCYHCQQEVCHTHFAQHSSMMMTDVYSLADRINTLTDDINTLSITQTHNNLFNQLQQWRDERINLIENIYTQKQVELNAKISQVDAVVNLVKVEKQQELSQIKTKITELIDAEEATFDQVNRLHKLVDEIAFDIDKIRTPAIRIETQPTNLDTCRIIYINQVSHAEPNTVSESVSKILIDDDARHSKGPINPAHSSENQSMATIKNNRAASSTPISGSIIVSHPSPRPLPPPIHVPSRIPTPPSFLPPYILHPSPMSVSLRTPPPSLPPYVPHSSSRYVPSRIPTPPPFSPLYVLHPSSRPVPSHIPTPPPFPRPPILSPPPLPPTPPPLFLSSSLPQRPIPYSNQYRPPASMYQQNRH